MGNDRPIIDLKIISESQISINEGSKRIKQKSVNNLPELPCPIINLNITYAPTARLMRTKVIVIINFAILNFKNSLFNLLRIKNRLKPGMKNKIIATIEKSTAKGIISF
ncbi:MAG: hypothetical protein Q8O89_01115 [Nanoarchaeota archaeon]|nr:hypothetical protein [Nanoarchaeota archaeon]